MLINFRKKVTVSLFHLCMKVKKWYINICNMKSLWMYVWAGQQIKEKYQNGCHLKLQVRITKYLMCIYGGYMCICMSCDDAAASPLVNRWVSAPYCPPTWDIGIHGPLGISATVWGGRDRLNSRFTGSKSLDQSGPSYFGRWVGCSQSEAVLPFSAGNAYVQTMVTSRLL